MLAAFGEVLVMDWACHSLRVEPDGRFAPRGPAWAVPASYMGRNSFRTDGADRSRRRHYLLGAILYEIVPVIRPDEGSTAHGACRPPCGLNGIRPPTASGELLDVALKAHGD